ncbi:hypothetical protein WA556_001217 [Blastocystis sp. ATCC 50177/Nand II]
MGIWTRHTTEDGRVFYYNMKRDRSKWESDFQHEMHTECTENKSMDNANRDGSIKSNMKVESGEMMTGMDERAIEQMTREAALKERERMVREAKEAKKKPQVVDPTLRQYQEKVKEFLV